MPLIVTGTVGIDSITTPSHGRQDHVLGGSCSYFAASAQHLAPVRVVAAVGEDFPVEFHQRLRSFPGVDVRGLELRKGSKTFRWGGRYMQNMDQRESLFTELNVLSERPPAVPAEFRDSKVVFLANTHPSVQSGMLDQIESPTLVVADTMDFWIASARAELDALLRRLDGLVLNYDEAQQLTGLANTVAAARRITQMGPSFVVVKKGEHGCLFVHKDRIGALPAYPSEVVVDPTGAGDSFAGGMMAALARASNNGHAAEALRDFGAFKRALAVGTVMASFTIERFGLDRLASLQQAELSARLGQFLDMVRA